MTSYQIQQAANNLYDRASDMMCDATYQDADEEALMLEMLNAATLLNEEASVARQRELAETLQEAADELDRTLEMDFCRNCGAWM